MNAQTVLTIGQEALADAFDGFLTRSGCSVDRWVAG